MLNYDWELSFYRMRDSSPDEFASSGESFGHGAIHHKAFRRDLVRINSSDDGESSDEGIGS
ncbi:hypothetical protein BH23BAC3_BH23BAC3_31150 [soil metagenome]